MGELYRNCDLDTVVNFLAKQVSYSCLEEEHKKPFDWPSSFQNVSKLTESNPKAMREELMQQCATILACYRLFVCFNRTLSSCQFFCTGKTAQAQAALDSWSCLSAWSCCLCTPTVSWRATPSLAAGWSSIKACYGFSPFFSSWVDISYLAVTSAVTTARSTCQQSRAWTWPAALSTSIPGRSQIMWTSTSIFLFQAYSPPHSKSRRNWHPWADQVTSRGCYCIYTITILQMHHGESQRRGRLLARKWDPCAPFCRACCWSPVDTGTVTVLFDYNVWPTNFYSDWLS